MSNRAIPLCSSTLKKRRCRCVNQIWSLNYFFCVYFCCEKTTIPKSVTFCLLTSNCSLNMGIQGYQYYCFIWLLYLGKSRLIRNEKWIFCFCQIVFTPAKKINCFRCQHFCRSSEEEEFWSCLDLDYSRARNLSFDHWNCESHFSQQMA